MAYVRSWEFSGFDALGDDAKSLDYYHNIVIKVVSP